MSGSTVAKGALVGALALLVGLAAPAAAQSPLEQVEQLTRLGRTEEARTALAAWWEAEGTEASRRDMQRALWLRGRLTVDPVQAELDFQRLVVLYPSGPFTADALLRLAQASWALGDEAAAREYVATLERDYATSDARERAVRWLADAGPVPPREDGSARAAEGERTTTARRPGPTVRQPESAPRPSEAAAPSGMHYYVQLGAFTEAERAVALHDSVRAEGVDVRVVRVDGSQFIHVRVGRFVEREDAVELLEALTERGISAALVRDDRAETRVRN